LCSGRQSELRA